MRILMIAQIFADTTRIGAKRPRAFAEHLARRGHSITVVCGDADNNLPARRIEGVDIIAASQSLSRDVPRGDELPTWQRLVVGASVLPSIPRAFILSNARMARLFGLNEARRAAAFEEVNERRKLTANAVKRDLASAKWAREAFDQLDEAFQQQEVFDVAWSTFGPLGSLWLGKRVSQKGLARAWVCDLRDSIAQPGPLLPVRVFRMLQSRSALRQATLLTAVSQGVREAALGRVLSGATRSKVRVVHNGFSRDPAESRQSSQESVSSAPEERQQLRIVYTGQVYAGRQDPHALFLAARRVARETGVRIQFHYAGSDWPLFEQSAVEAGVGRMAVNHGLLSRKSAERLQESADALLVLSWNEKGFTGVLTGKFAEYLGAGRPVIAMTSGKLPNSELTRMVRSLNVGVAVEPDADPSSSQEDLYRFLKEAAEHKRDGVPIPYSPDRRKLDRLSYSHLTGELERVLQQAIAKRPRGLLRGP